MGDTSIEVKSLGEELSRAPEGSVAKLDCEGCEWALLGVSCEVIQRIVDWAVEIHGAPTPIVWKMERCGFKSSSIATRGLISIWRFIYERELRRV
jgi:hypothetical protein